jgi:hypothetical protein
MIVISNNISYSWQNVKYFSKKIPIPYSPFPTPPTSSYNTPMTRFKPALVLLCLLWSCARSGQESPGGAGLPETETGARPAALLRAGAYPLWFQCGEAGPALIESIADARFSRALVPWPLAVYVRAMLAPGDGLAMAVNREGFVCLVPGEGQGRGGNTGGDIALFHVSGGEFWRQYTIGACVLFEGNPAALLYRDTRFLDTEAAVPLPRVWTVGPRPAVMEALDLPVLELFPPDAGWEADTLRQGPGGYWYYRLYRAGEQPDIRLLRSAGLDRPGADITPGDFQRSALPEPLDAAPAPMGELLRAAGAGSAAVVVISPELPAERRFAGSDPAGPVLQAYYRNGAEGPVAVAIRPDGRGLYLRPEPAGASPFALPPLPAGFVYTGIGLVSGGEAAATIVALWEEQEAYNTGAAGFMLIQIPADGPPAD